MFIVWLLCVLEWMRNNLSSYKHDFTRSNTKAWKEYENRVLIWYWSTWTYYRRHHEKTGIPVHIALYRWVIRFEI